MFEHQISLLIAAASGAIFAELTLMGWRQFALIFVSRARSAMELADQPAIDPVIPPRDLPGVQAGISPSNAIKPPANIKNSCTRLHRTASGPLLRFLLLKFSAIVFLLIVLKAAGWKVGLAEVALFLGCYIIYLIVRGWRMAAGRPAG